jgi:hypothetical protein
MATIQSGLFTLEEFSYRRNVLKFAPDAFVVVNGALTSRVISPMEAKSTQDIDIRGGISSINVTAAISPPGASRASIEVVAPLYKGIHEDYYVTLPNGTKVPFFMPMMEVKIYMKGRYLESEFDYVPRYYPVFWGMITNVQENYSDGNFTISITCEDFLCWWKYQKITINPSVQDAFFGGAPMIRFPSVFEKMSAWEIIYSLFVDSFFAQHGDNGAATYYNFVFPKWSKSVDMPDSLIATRETFGPLSSLVINYWNDRFGMGVDINNQDPKLLKEQLEKIPLRMYGLRGPINYDTIKNKMLTFLDTKSGNFGAQADSRADLDLDFGLLSRVQPYGLFELFGGGSESTIFSKLEIATSICEKVYMEFFVDMNGEIVFKPPFYNLDVASGKVPYYRVGPDEIINFNASFDSNSIVNYLVVTGPKYQSLSTLEATGFYADFDSIKRYGIRSDQVHVPYGMNGKQLKMIAVAETAKRNGQAYTGSVSIPLRPEMRLGYPVYIEHIDTFYYVTGINHNFTFGSSAVTELSIQCRREKIFDDGHSGVPGSQLGDVLYSCVMRDKEADLAKLIKEGKIDTATLKNKIKALADASNQLKTGEQKSQRYDPKDLDKRINEWKKQLISAQNGVFEGPGLLGLWKIDRANIKKRTQDQIRDAGDGATYTANELVMITNESVPYTDKLGYRHIGAFPYGANLVLTKEGKMLDSTNFIDVQDQGVEALLNSSGMRNEISYGVSSVANQDIVGSISNSTVLNKDQKELAIATEKSRMDKLYSTMDDVKQQQNEQSIPSFYDNVRIKEGIAALYGLDTATRAMMDVPINTVDQCQVEANQNESTYSG